MSNMLISAMLKSFGFEPDAAMKGFERILSVVEEADRRLKEISEQLAQIDAKLNTLYHAQRGENAEIKNALAVLHNLIYDEGTRKLMDDYTRRAGNSRDHAAHMGDELGCQKAGDRRYSGAAEVPRTGSVDPDEAR